MSQTWPEMSPKLAILRCMTVGQPYCDQHGDAQISSAMFLVALVSAFTTLATMRISLGWMSTKGSGVYNIIDACPVLLALVAISLLLLVTCATNKVKVTWIQVSRVPPDGSQSQFRIVAMVIFGLGASAMSMIFVFDDAHCVSREYLQQTLWMVTTLIQAIFYPLQTMFIVTITMNGVRYEGNPLIRHVFLAIVSFNAMLYVNYLVSEAQMTLHYMHTREDNATTPVLYVWCPRMNASVYNEFSGLVVKYLEPFTTEYNLTAIALMLSIWTMMGCDHTTENDNRRDDSSRMVTENSDSSQNYDLSPVDYSTEDPKQRHLVVHSDATHDRYLDYNGNEEEDCESSRFLLSESRHRENEADDVTMIIHVWACLILLCLFRLVVQVLNDVDPYYDNGVTSYIHRSTNIIYLIVKISMLYVGFWCLDGVKKVSVSIDRGVILLLIGGIGSLTLILLQGVASFACMFNLDSSCQNQDGPVGLSGFIFGQTLLGIIHHWLQITLLFHTHSCSRNVQGAELKNLRAVNHMLALMNMFDWCQKSVLDRNLQRGYPTARIIYGEMFWAGFIRIFVPFSLFFYFHSAIMFLHYRRLLMTQSDL